MSNDSNVTLRGKKKEKIYGQTSKKKRRRRIRCRSFQPEVASLGQGHRDIILSRPTNLEHHPYSLDQVINNNIEVRKNRTKER